MNDKIYNKEFVYEWCIYLIKYFLSIGIDHFFIASGGRSLFLLSALAHEKCAKIYWGIDERSLGFMGLGFAKKNKRPCIVITTSGTAVANLYPSIVEAYYSETPLILLTADVPSSLRNRGNNQTIDQNQIFSKHVKNSIDFPVPCENFSLKESLFLINKIINISLTRPFGPIHINIQFPDPALFDFKKKDLIFNYQDIPDISVKKEESDIDKDIFMGPGLLVVGEMAKNSCQEKIIDLAEKINWPIYADISSNMRFYKHHLIWHHFELSLKNFNFFPKKIEKIVFLGQRIISKDLWQLIEKNNNLNCYRISESSNIIDPIYRVKHILVNNLAKALDKIPYLKNGIGLDKEIHDKVSIISQEFLSHPKNNEAFYCNFIFNMEEIFDVFISSSMPIRDINYFACKNNFKGEILVNRGASGIDGIISTACGAFLDNDRPGVLIIGDLAFLHDTNGLMLIKKLSKPMLIILINNNGGGIFQFMSVKNHKSIFDPYVLSPHSTSIEYLCMAHDIKHVKVLDHLEFDDTIKNFFAKKNHLVIEVIIDREENFRLHEQCFLAIKDTSVL